VIWLQGTLLGTIATTVAIIAVSWVGMLMLMGRFEIRRGRCCRRRRRRDRRAGPAVTVLAA
jgi:hypothetical protein